MGLWYALHPFDSEKFYEEIVPSLKMGLTNRPDLFEGYKRTCIDGKTELTTDQIASIASQFDSEFKSYPGYEAYTTDRSEFSVDHIWLYEWSKLFEFVVFHECAYYDPEFAFGKTGLASAGSRFNNIPLDSAAEDIFTTLSNETIFSCYSMGIVNWVPNEDVKLLLLDAKNIQLADSYKEDSPDLYDYDLYEFLAFVDKHSLGLIYGVDLAHYQISGRTLS